MRTPSKMLLAIAALLFSWAQTDACTNVIITKGASKDGSVMVTYAADSHQLFGEIYYRPAGKYAAGTMMDVWCWDSGKYMGQIPQVARTYQTVGNMNEHQLTITETTFGGREELANTEGVMEYGALIWTTLQRARTAREAIEVLDGLMQEYGYCSEGESFSIADTEEAWIMEIVGKGEQKGAVWAAARIPDGYICSHANQSRIHHIDFDDPDNWLYSPDVVSFAREKGYFDGPDEEFSFCDAYCPADFGGLRGCEGRVWSAFNKLGGGNFTYMDKDGEHTAPASDWLDFAMGYDTAHKMPLFIKPAAKVDVKDVADVMRDHYEGTPMDMTVDLGAGPHHIPYRWRPMGFKVDGKSYVHERAIATQQTGYWILCQSRGWLDDAVGGVLWFGVDDAATSCLTPVYTSTLQIPECFREGNGDMLHYSPTSAFWLFNRVTHFAYLMYDRVAPELQAAATAHERRCMEEMKAIDEKAQKYAAKGRVKKARKIVTKYSVETAQKLFDEWSELGNHVLVKYMDGNIKHQNEDGSFKDNGESKTIPQFPMQPAYPENWYKMIVDDHGDVIEVK